MSSVFSEDQVHQHLYQQSLEDLIANFPSTDNFSDNEYKAMVPTPLENEEHYKEGDFELWKIVKEKALKKLQRLNDLIKYGNFIGSKIKLPINKTRPMELDLLGQHDEGLFILELKVDRSAERNAFSELLAYSNYIAEIFALSGHKDITNILVSNLDVKITRQAFLYDLIINDRNVIVYNPTFTDNTLESLRLQIHILDDDFRYFTNQHLSHNAMSCIVASFHDLDNWFDSKETNQHLQDRTIKHLEKLSSYTAQLMESEGLNGFCFIRKPWNEIESYYRNSLVICAINL
jgi:hypothetical protein